MTTLLSTPEQSRARYPDEEGYVERDGVRVFWERYGEGEPTVLLPPTWEIVHSRFWKGQIPYLARHDQGGHLRPPGQRPLRPPGRLRRLRPARVRRRRPGRAGRGRGRPGGGGLVVRHGRVADPGRRAPRAGRRAGVHRAADVAPRTRPGRLPVRLRSGHRRRLGQGDPRLLAAGLARVPGVLLRHLLDRAPLDQADRGLRRLGRGHRHGDDPGRVPGLGDQDHPPGRGGRPWRPGPLPGAGDPRDRGRPERGLAGGGAGPPARRPAGPARGGRARAPRPRPGEGQRAGGRVRRGRGERGRRVPRSEGPW